MFVTFASGGTAQRQLVTLPLASPYVPRAGDDTDEAQLQRNTYRAAVYEHQVHGGVTARIAFLLQNGGAVTAEEALIELTIPDGLQMAFTEKEAPPKSVKKTPPVALELSPRAWRSDSETRAHCGVARVTSSVALPQVFLTLRDRAGAGKFVLSLKVSAAGPVAEQTSKLVLEFNRP